MNELDLYAVESSEDNPFSNMFGDISERAQMIADHKHWLQTIRHEQPNPAVSFRVGVYIRFFNQTKYEDYLEHHKKQYLDTLALCPNWTLVDFYIDEGSSAPSMRSALEWSRLLNDAMEGKVDLIITQKVSNVSRSPEEITFCSRILATQTPPVGVCFEKEYIETALYLIFTPNTGLFFAYCSIYCGFVGASEPAHCGMSLICRLNIL